MSTVFKKILVLLPVVLLGLIYFYDHSVLYERTSNTRLLFLAFTYAVLYGWIFLETILRKQVSFWDIGLQAGFFIYLFMILVLTGYFNLFREIASQDWWERIMLRIERKDRVNLKLFQIFSIYKKTDTQIFGNLVMLFPLGIFIPLLYKKLRSFFVTVFFCFLVSLAFECVQLATRFRSADVDDVFLNTLGAAAGAIVFNVCYYLFTRSRPGENRFPKHVKPLA